MSVFGTGEERELARRLLPSTPVEREPEHPKILLDRLHVTGTQSERDYLGQGQKTWHSASTSSTASAPMQKHMA
jgi:hypothetical protein